MGVVAKKVRLPEVTGYIAAGILLKQLLLQFDFMSERLFERLTTVDLIPINHLALALIAFAVCGGLRFEQLKKMGRGIICIAFVQAGAAFGAVVAAVLFVSPLTSIEGIDPGRMSSALPLALVLGGIATATAPAATVAVIRELRAKGPFTMMLLATVAIDDAIALLIFAFGLKIAESLMTFGAADGSVLTAWFGPLLETAGSMLLGGAVGLVHHLVARNTRRDLETMTVSLGIITFASGLSMLVGFSPLLTVMTAGFVLANLSRRNQRVFSSVESIQGPIFVVFFTLAGTQLHLENLMSCGIIGGAFLIARFAGKVGGSYLGASIANVKGTAKRYLGLALLPQAGVAIGLMLIAQHSPHFSVHKGILVDVVLASVAVNELVGPPLAALALHKAKETAAEAAAPTTRITRERRR